MKPENLANLSAPNELMQFDFGIGVVPIYQLNDGIFIVAAEYHNKGALSPTVGSRLSSNNFYETLNEAFRRKRFSNFSGIAFDGDIDDNIFYSINENQKLARLTFVNKTTLNISAAEFNQRYVLPMHTEAQCQGSVSNFFWRLDQTLNNSKFGTFKTNELQIMAAREALNKMEQSRLPIKPEIRRVLDTLKDGHPWSEKETPLQFYSKQGGREYSELSGFYLIPLAKIIEALKNPEVKELNEKGEKKQTVLLKCDVLPESKEFFIFEDEIKTIAAIAKQLMRDQASHQTLFEPALFNKTDELISPWTVRNSTLDKLQFNFSKDDSCDERPSRNPAAAF